MKSARSRVDFSVASLHAAISQPSSSVCPSRTEKPPSERVYLLIPGLGAAPLPPAGAPLLGLRSCPEPGGAEMEVGAPAAGTAGPGCPACPSPSMLASFPIPSSMVSAETSYVVDASTAVIKTQRKLSGAPLPPSSPTIQHPARSTRTEGEGCGSALTLWVARTCAFTTVICEKCKLTPQTCSAMAVSSETCPFGAPDSTLRHHLSLQ